MENNIELRPNPVTISYLRQFQMAQLNLNLFISEERLQKRKRKTKNAARIS